MSMENRHVLERKLGRALPNPEQKVTLTVDALCAIVEAGRRHERSKRPELSLFEQVFGR